LGGLAGSLGAVVSFSGAAKGAVTILAGIFMVVMGLNMLNVFPWLRRFNLSMPKVFGRGIHAKAGSKGPLAVGLLNGLMPCGPLQAMQLYALGTGSFATGAVSMFLFSAGTVPLVFGLGSVGSWLKGGSARKLMRVSAVLVVLLGMIMLNRGLNLSGYHSALALGGSGGTASVARMEGGVQVVSTRLEPGGYQPIVVQKGVPVKWNIIAADEDLNGCNDAIIAREFWPGDRKLGVGDNFIEFTPDKEGNFVYTCWMGMISSSITVVSDLTQVSGQDINQLNQQDALDGS
jgi:sulfite exporter TauE/SafE